MKELIIGILLIIIGLTTGSGESLTKGAQMLVTVGTQLALNGIVKLMTDEPESLDEQESTLFNGRLLYCNQVYLCL